MTPRLEACYFGAGRSSEEWPRLARVLASSAARHCPGWTIHVTAIAPPPARRASALGVQADVCNAVKLDRWQQLVAEASDGECLVLIDVDTMILRPLDSAWKHAFDLAYTVKPAGARFPLNGGVVFVRVSDRVRTFMGQWAAVNDRMLQDGTLHQAWRRRYGGINQAALGCVLETGSRTDLQLLPLPCAEWNCEDESWSAFDAHVTRIVHLKGLLRRAVFHRSIVTDPHALRLAAVWRELEASVSTVAERIV